MVTLPPLVTVEHRHRDAGCLSVLMAIILIPAEVTRPPTNQCNDYRSLFLSVLGSGGAGMSPQSPTIRAWSIQPDQSGLILKPAFAAGGQTGFVIFFPAVNAFVRPVCAVLLDHLVSP